MGSIGFSWQSADHSGSSAGPGGLGGTKVAMACGSHNDEQIRVMMAKQGPEKGLRTSGSSMMVPDLMAQHFMRLIRRGRAVTL